MIITIISLGLLQSPTVYKLAVLVFLDYVMPVLIVICIGELGRLMYQRSTQLQLCLPKVTMY